MSSKATVKKKKLQWRKENIGAAYEFIGRLVKDFPETFFSEGAKDIPTLKVGMLKDLKAHYKGEVKVDMIRLALSLYVRTMRYQTALATGKGRVDLEGKMCDTPRVAHREQAQHIVKKIGEKKKKLVKPKKPAHPGKKKVEVNPGKVDKKDKGKKQVKGGKAGEVKPNFKVAVRKGEEVNATTLNLPIITIKKRRKIAHV